MKKFLLFALAALAFVSCNFNPPTDPKNHEALHSYVGTAVVDSDYVTSEIVVDLITSDSIKGAYMVYFHDTKFAEKMPQMDIIIDGLTKIDDNHFECDNIVPDMVMGIIRVPVQKYLITNLHATITHNDKNTTMKLVMNCGQYFLDFTGVYSE
jgi:hypothetical protein